MKTTRILGIALGLASAATLTAGTARADYPDGAPYIGAYGGGNFNLRDWDLGKAARDSDPIRPKSSPMLGLRAGYQLMPQLALEVGGGWLPVKSTEGEKNTAFLYTADAIFHVLPGDWTPFVDVGAGGYYVKDGGDLGKDDDWQVHLGLGGRGLITPNVALRAEVRDYKTDGYDAFGGNNLEVTAGVDIFLTAPESAPAPADRDHDGVLDQDDRCPDTAGLAALQGCPDSDGDGIADADDKCPSDPGEAAFQGCPNPDKDGDTVPDATDRCPDEPGDPALQGCPDRDKDGIADAEDKCPDTAGPPSLQGCPDRDGDKVIDMADKCPDEPGLPEHDGCMPEGAKKFTGTIQGITFELGSARIRPQSFPVIDGAVALLKEYPTLRLRIDGHTDDQGKDDANQKLSEDRAASVKAYMVSKGVEEGRIDTAGYGETRPVQDNKTAAGRSANRRIEFAPLTSK